MKVKCQACEGYGSVVTERSVRQGHTHGNDPDTETETCDVCYGSGDVDATPSDLDGMRAKYLWIVGVLTWQRDNDTLTIEDDEGVQCCNLLPEHVEIFDGLHQS